MTDTWDVIVVGAGPAGAATALGVLRSAPRARVLLLDRADFPRDKSCGDGIAPHVIDLLARAGVTGIVDDRVAVRRLRLVRDPVETEREMRRPAWVVPRTVFDARLVDAAVEAGAELRRHRVRSLGLQGDRVVLDAQLAGRIVVGADGAHSVVARAIGRRPGPMAVALRGYAPTPPARAGAQVISFGTRVQPSYAWSFDRGDGLANVGYGELVTGRAGLTRTTMLERLEELLPGAAADARDWVGHQLPLSTARWRPPAGPVLLAGDAAGLVNPLTGEGIFYAVATGLAAGRAAADALASGAAYDAGRRHRSLTRPLLGRHLRHTALASRLARHAPVLDAGLRASARDQQVFDDLVELGLAGGPLTPGLVRGLARELVAATTRDLHGPRRPRRQQGEITCAS